MEIVHKDVVIDVPSGITPPYKVNNPLTKLLTLMEQVQFAASREVYLTPQMQYLFPIEDLTMYGPAGADHDILDPVQQDNKTDFQKQNVCGLPHHGHVPGPRAGGDLGLDRPVPAHLLPGRPGLPAIPAGGA